MYTITLIINFPFINFSYHFIKGFYVNNAYFNQTVIKIAINNGNLF